MIAAAASLAASSFSATFALLLPSVFLFLDVVVVSGCEDSATSSEGFSSAALSPNRSTSYQLLSPSYSDPSKSSPKRSSSVSPSPPGVFIKSRWYHLSTPSSHAPKRATSVQARWSWSNGMHSGCSPSSPGRLTLHQGRFSPFQPSKSTERSNSSRRLSMNQSFSAVKPCSAPSSPRRLTEYQEGPSSRTLYHAGSSSSASIGSSSSSSITVSPSSSSSSSSVSSVSSFSSVSTS